MSIIVLYVYTYSKTLVVYILYIILTFIVLANIIVNKLTLINIL